MYQLSAAAAFQVEVLMALLFVFDVLIAGACFAVNDEFPHSSCLNKAVKLAINGRHTNGRADRTEIVVDFLRAGVLVLIIYKEIKKFFLLCRIITRIFFHIITR
jgi:hypothetical protein